MGVLAGALGVRVEPPFGDGVFGIGLGAVGFEDGADAAHEVGAALAGLQDDGGAGESSGVIMHGSRGACILLHVFP